MTKKLKYVGKSIPMHDVNEKVTGKTKYIGDMKMSNMLYAKLLLSDIPHGVIKSIDTYKAEKLEGVIKVYTYKNTPDTPYNSHIWYAGLDAIKDEHLFSKHVKFHGDRIAAVVAVNRQVAEQAIGLIKVEYEKLPHITNPMEALKNPDYKISSKEIKSGDTDNIFEQAQIIVETELETQKVHHAAMETHVCLANKEVDGSITIWTPCQVVFQVRLVVCEALGLSMNKVRVIKATMGGSFGGKGQPVLEPICAYMAYDLGVPVKLQMDRAESIIGTRTRTATIGNVRTAVDEDGNILARDIRMTVDAGAYMTNGEAVAMAMGKKAFRLYRIQNQQFKADVVYTNTPIGGACRGYGSPQIHALTEINLDAVARKLNMDPAELRLKNLVHPYDNDTIGGPPLGNARVIECVQRGMEAFGWKKRLAKKKIPRRFVSGIGMACATHGNGYYGAYQDFITMSLRMNENGELFLNSGIHDLGCGTVTTMKQIVAEVFDIPVEKILATEGDTLISPFDSAGTQASRVTFVCGACAKKVAELVREKLIKYAAKILDCNEAEIALEDGMIYCTSNPDKKHSYASMVMKIQKTFFDEIGASYTHQSQANPASYAVNFVEVEVDTMTGMVYLIDILAVHDVGRAINPGFVEGQIQGAIQMGIGFALSEEVKVDNNGIVKETGFSKYHVINAPDMPEVKVLLIEDGEEHGPFGAKSVGEISTVAITPAIINAISNAIDISITALPATPERILEAIKRRDNISEV
jgi:xanthine dehydrogenase molybdenum-binding subunit